MKELEALVEAGRLMEERPEASLLMAARWLRVRDRQGLLRPLHANAAQRKFEEARGRQNIVLKARQMGITTWVAGRFFLRTITRPGTLTVQVAHTRAAAEAIYTTVERMWQNLPEELREGPLRRSRANAGQMVFPELGSEFRAWSAGDENAGRGLSIQNLHCSEVARWPGDAAATLAGLRAALAPDGELVLESTPNGAYGAFYEEWRKAKGRGFRGEGLGFREGRVKGVGIRGQEPTHRDEAAMDGAPREDGAPGVVGGLVRHFLPWWMEEAYVGPAVSAWDLTMDEAALAEKHGLSPEQIGFRRGLERTFGALRSQEFAEDAETCFRATGACCFDVEAIERRMKEAPRSIEKRRGGALLVWLPPVPGKDYCVAVDPAGGNINSDFSAVQVIEQSTGVQCAELQERLRPEDVAKEAVKLAREYNGALLAVERNNQGLAVLAYLDMREGYGRVYRNKGNAGFLTTAASKPEVVARMGLLLREAPERFMSRRLLGECRTFVDREGGRSGAANGSYDDLVMAMGIAQMVVVEQTVERRQ